MIALSLMAMVALPSSPDLGKAEGRCRPDEPGPAFVVEAVGLKDRSGLLKLEVYPATDADFLQDDNILLNAGKVFRRVEMPVPQSGPVMLCIRVPTAGIYTLSLMHDRDANHRFSLSIDGAGFPNNPRLGLSKPRAAAVAVRAGSGPTRLRIVMNYRRGLMSFGPIGS